MITFYYERDCGEIRNRQNVFCGYCGDGVGMVGYKIFMNDLNDTILKGKCSKCGGKVVRYLETGENI